MKYIFTISVLLLILWGCSTEKNAGATRVYHSGEKADSLMIRKIYDEALSKGESYENLRYLCKSVGARLSGSHQAAKAVEWGKKVMEKMGCDTVFLQPVMVPHWVRGNIEEAAIVSDKRQIAAALDVCALGNSVGTDEKGIQAKVVMVNNFEELKLLGKEKIKGKIVFFNRPMDEKLISTFHAYGGCVNQRVNGASQAAQFGALAVLVRSMTLHKDDFPHTGVLHYEDSLAKIPAAALSLNSADALSRKLKQEPELEVYLNLSCKMLEDVLSYNVVGEIKGTQYKDKYIAVGGHLDSWDKGEGAHDDGAGIVQSMEVLRILKAIGYRPRHSIRAVLFMNEENGARGATKYEEEAARNNCFHLFAIESDAGGFTPRGFSVDGDSAIVAQVQAWKGLLSPYGLHDLDRGGSGVDVGPLKKQGTVVMGYRPDSQRYFDHHHADSDVFEAVHQRELEMGGAGMAALVYLLDKYFEETPLKLPKPNSI